MRSAVEMKEITDKVIIEQCKSSDEILYEILEKIDAYIYKEAIDGEYLCYISETNELFKYMCEDLITQQLNIAGYTITPLYDIDGKLYGYIIEWQ